MGFPFDSGADRFRPLVLVVDDEPLLRRLMADVLGECYRVLEAADGREALTLFDVAGGEIAAVVTDVRMPDVDGLALARALGSCQRPPPILFISGFSAGSDVPGQLLEKPFTPGGLLRAVQHLLAGSSHEAQEIEQPHG